MGEFERLIVGLGNPGRQYEHTAHNLGFLVVDRLGERNGIRVRQRDCMALVGTGSIAGHKVMLAKPQTFMNVSGSSVCGLFAKFGFEAKDLLVVCDDLDLAWQSVRIRPSGSAGGHHGIESVIDAVKTRDFPRVRIGIHGGDRDRDGARIVLSRFSKARKKELDELLDYVSQAVESIVAEGVEKSMTRFNRRAQGLNEEAE